MGSPKSGAKMGEKSHWPTCGLASCFPATRLAPNVGLFLRFGGRGRLQVGECRWLGSQQRQHLRLLIESDHPNIRTAAHIEATFQPLLLAVGQVAGVAGCLWQPLQPQTVSSPFCLTTAMGTSPLQMGATAKPYHCRFS